MGRALGRVILLDTNVLVYAAGTEHPLRAPCREILRAARDERVDARVTEPCLLELLHVWSRRRPRADAARLAGIYTRLLGAPVRTGDDVLERAADIFRDHEALGSVDAHLAAAARLLGAEILVSADRAFRDVEGLAPRAPDHADVSAILGRA